jgi:hypothetical protein
MFDFDFIIINFGLLYTKQYFHYFGKLINSCMTLFFLYR